VGSDGLSDPHYDIKEKKLINITNFPKESNDNYEHFNILSNNGDTIIDSSHGEEYVSLNFVIDIVKEIVQQELVAAGVLKK